MLQNKIESYPKLCIYNPAELQSDQKCKLTTIGKDQIDILTGKVLGYLTALFDLRLGYHALFLFSRCDSLLLRQTMLVQLQCDFG